MSRYPALILSALVLCGAAQITGTEAATPPSAQAALGATPYASVLARAKPTLQSFGRVPLTTAQWLAGTLCVAVLGASRRRLPR